MNNISKEETIAKLEEIVTKFEKNDFNVYFFVVDTKNSPNGGVEYMYDIALNLHNRGYNVTMLHHEDEFVGPIEWLGERYSVLEHRNVEKNNVPISASDFLFIPEVLAQVMTQTKNLPCRRILLYHNPEYMLEYMPVGVTVTDLGIYDAVTTDRKLEKRLQTYFPKLRTNLVRPSVKTCFYPTQEPKKLIVNIMGSGMNDINNILKPFFWKYPAYRWVSFRNIQGIAQTVCADVLREGAITIWSDDVTVNAKMALEALKCNNILIAKIPNVIPDWMMDGDELRKDIIWFDTFEDLHGILASVIRGWTRNDIVEDFMTVSKKIEKVFSPEIQDADIQMTIIDGIFKNRLNEYKQILSGMKNKKENE